MHRIALILLLAVAAAPLLAQQPPPKPAPPDISGTYSFLQEGETLQLGLDATGRVDGVISRYGTGETEKGRLFDHLFTKAALKGDDLTFTTRTVHAVWYEFKGRIQRGPGKNPSDEDYYEVVGALTEHIIGPNNTDSARQREVTFKSFPDIDQQNTPPPK